MITIYPQKADVLNNPAGGEEIRLTTALIFEELNGEYSCSLTSLDKIKAGQIVKLPTPYGEDFFRLGEPERNLTAAGNLIYSARGWHLSYDLANDIIVNRRWENKTANETVAGIVAAGMEDTPFVGSSDITGQATIGVIRRSPIEALIGDHDSSFIARFGGEIERIGKDIKMLARRGSTAEKKIEYRKNLTGLTVTERTDQMINRIVPTYLSNPTTAALLPEQHIDSPNMPLTAVPHAVHIHFGDIIVGQEIDDIVPFPDKASAEREVRARVQKLYDDGIDEPFLTVNVRFLALDELGIDKVAIGDNVRVVYKDDLFDLRAISYTWDCLRERYKEVQIGSQSRDLRRITETLAGREAQEKETLRMQVISSLVAAKTDLNDMVLNAMGFYTTEVTLENGAKQVYMHDRPRLEDSRYIAYIPEAGTFVSTTNGWNNGNPVWDHGMDKEGNAILNVLYAYGVNAEWVHVGDQPITEWVNGRLTITEEELRDEFTNLNNASVEDMNNIIGALDSTIQDIINDDTVSDEERLDLRHELERKRQELNEYIAKFKAVDAWVEMVETTPSIEAPENFEQIKADRDTIETIFRDRANEVINLIEPLTEPGTEVTTAQRDAIVIALARYYEQRQVADDFLSQLTKTQWTTINKAMIELNSILGTYQNQLVLEPERITLKTYVDNKLRDALQLMSNRISFINEGQEVAFIEQTMMFIERVRILNELHVGNHVYIKEPNGITAHYYRGDE